MNKLAQMNILFSSDPQKINAYIRSNRFKTMEEIDDGFFELEMSKKRIKLDTPIVLGFAILQYAKLRMLQFYYDCLDKYIDRRDFQLCEMDTDSNYMALSAPLFDVIRSNLRSEFFNQYGQWFPRLACPQHHNTFIATLLRGGRWNMHDCCKKVNKLDQREPGLFKEEFKGVGIISLNSKTYFCWSDDPTNDKYRSKGLSRRQNRLTRDQFMDVLNTKTSVDGQNIGFRVKNGQTFTYQQTKTGLSYLYTKRYVLDDGVNTTPLSI
jgi:hypothetical protein